MSIPVGVTSFLHLVPHVIGDASEPKVFITNTKRNIAFVKNLNSWRNGAVLQFPCETMGTYAVAFSILANSMKLSVAIIEPASGPQPVLAALVNVAPETIDVLLREHITSNGVVCAEDLRPRNSRLQEVIDQALPKR